MTETTNKPAAKKAAAPKAEAKPAAKAKGTPARNKAYQAATGKLRDEYRDRFEALLEAECAARGVRYSRRLTAEEKAARTVAKLLSEHPGIRGQVAGQLDDQEPETAAVVPDTSPEDAAPEPRFQGVH